LSRWDQIFNANDHRLTDLILVNERDNRSKFGPRSIAKPWGDRRSSVQDYFDLTNDSLRLPDFLLPLGRGRLRPLSVDAAAAYLKSDTNSGLPFVTRKSQVRDQVVTDFNRLLGRKDPCVLFTRTQENNKTRNVWGYPIVDTLNEMMFYQPLLKYQRSLSWRSALCGPDIVDKNITRIIKDSGSKYIVSIDFSSFMLALNRNSKRKLLTT
jgi:hypothetical protein